jgi:hypothetical protein
MSGTRLARREEQGDGDRVRNGLPPVLHGDAALRPTPAPRGDGGAGSGSRSARRAMNGACFTATGCMLPSIPNRSAPSPFRSPPARCRRVRLWLGLWVPNPPDVGRRRRRRRAWTDRRAWVIPRGRRARCPTTGNADEDTRGHFERRDSSPLAWAASPGVRPPRRYSVGAGGLASGRFLAAARRHGVRNVRPRRPLEVKMMSQANGLPETTGRHGECHLALVDADALSPSGLAVAGMGCPNCAIPVRTDPARARCVAGGRAFHPRARRPPGWCSPVVSCVPNSGYAAMEVFLVSQTRSAEGS